MKKFLIAILIAVAAACCAIAVTACAGSHEHSWSDWTVVEGHEPTCTENGLESRKCSGCGETETRTVERLGHTSVTVDLVEPTCTEAGHTAGKVCSECGTVLEGCEELGALDHDWKTATPNGDKTHTLICSHDSTHTMVEDCIFDKPTATTATCTEGGTYTYECEKCGYSYSEYGLPLGHDLGKPTYDNNRLPDEHTGGTHTARCQRNDCDYYETEDCSYDIVNVPATCTDEGYNIYTCIDCGDSFEQDRVSAAGHRWGEEILHFEEDGKHYHGRVCLTDRAHVEKIECSFTETDTPATCTEGGYKTYTCNGCKYTYTVATQSSTGHNLTDWAPSEEDGVFIHSRYCQNIGCDFKEKAECRSFGATRTTAATCTDDGKIEEYCLTCNQTLETTVLTKLGHNLKYVHNGAITDEESQHTETCQRANCGYSETVNCTFTTAETEATCTEGGTVYMQCEGCHASYTEDGEPARGHIFGNYISNSRSSNAYVGNHYRICGVCNYREPVTQCTLEEIISQPATCTTTGKSIYRCIYCPNSYETTKAALGHVWETDGEGNTVWEIMDGYHISTCIRPDCNYRLFSAHTYTQTNFCDTCGNDGLEYIMYGAGYYVFNDDKVAGAKRIIVPEMHGDYPVTGIVDAIQNNRHVAFYGNPYIEEVELPETLQYIGLQAFYNCEKLKKVTIANEDDGDAFNPSLKEIGAYAFYKCVSLQSADNLPETLTTIGAGAFFGCAKLASITLPASVNSIGQYAFRDTAYYNDVNNWTPSDNGLREALYINHFLIRVNPEIGAGDANGEYRIAEGTTHVGANAFENCVNLVTLYIPNSVTEFGTDAFNGCDNLASVNYDGRYAEWVKIKFYTDKSSPMYYATYINIGGAEGEITIDEGVTAIPAGAFKGTAITSITLPSTITSIGDEAFENCTLLTTIIINPASKINSVGFNAFKNSGFYNNDDSWRDGALYIGTLLIEVRAEALNEGAYAVISGTTVIGSGAFMGLSELTEVTIPSSVITIGAHAFIETSLERANFESTDGWFANNDYICRSVDKTALADPKQAATIMGYYQNIWRRTSAA